MTIRTCSCRSTARKSRYWRQDARGADERAEALDVHAELHETGAGRGAAAAATASLPPG